MKDVSAEVFYNRELGGGYFRLGLRTLWSEFVPGQFVMLRVPDNKVLVRRPFSISKSIPDGIEIVCKIVGRGTETIGGLKSGGEIPLLGPLGNGFKIVDGMKRGVIVAGGFGVAPFVEMTKRLSAAGIPTDIFFGGKSAADIILEDDLKEAGATLHIATEDGSIGHKGYITELLSKEIDNFLNDSVIYCCGPRGLLDAVIKIAREKDLPAQISYETYMGCGIGVCLGCVVETREGYKRACADGPVFDIANI